MIRLRGMPTAAGPLDLDVAAGEVVLLEGPNGSGKTSLLRALAGLDAPLTPRSVRVAGADPRTRPAGELPARVHLALQDARDNLVGLLVRGEFALRRRSLPPTLARLARRDVATLSSGEARAVALALAEASAAPLCLLDEPAEGLDTAGRARLAQLVARVRDAGGAVVAADHAGALAPLATRRVRLGGTGDPARVAFPEPDGAARLHAPATALRRGAVALPLPALALGRGLHAIVGPNGSGKTTLLHRLCGLDASRDVTLDGAPVEPGRTARLLPARARDLLLEARVSDELAAAEEAIARALVPDALRDRHPLALSGGEAQRVALARVLGEAAPLYALDEPEAHLDADGRAALLGILAQRVREGSVVAVATHDPALLAHAHARHALEGPA